MSFKNISCLLVLFQYIPIPSNPICFRVARPYVVITLSNGKVAYPNCAVGYQAKKEA